MLSISQNNLQLLHHAYIKLIYAFWIEFNKKVNQEIITPFRDKSSFPANSAHLIYTDAEKDIEVNCTDAENLQPNSQRNYTERDLINRRQILLNYTEQKINDINDKNNQSSKS